MKPDPAAPRVESRQFGVSELRPLTFEFGKQCCFCGDDNTDGAMGYAGERTCSSCGKGGFGEPDEAYMAYRGYRNAG